MHAPAHLCLHARHEGRHKQPMKESWRLATPAARHTLWIAAHVELLQQMDGLVSKQTP